MYPYMNEDAAWQRLKDLQREMENSRVMAGDARAMVGSVRWLAERLWLLAGLAAQRAPRRRPRLAAEPSDEAVATSDAA